MKHLPVIRILLLLALLAATGSAQQRIRLMGGNISSGNYQSYDPGHGARIFKGLDPDIVMIQEFNYAGNAASDIRKFVTDTFGAEFSYFRETGAQIPNGIISRFPILAAGEWTDPKVSNRDFAWARIDIPGDKDLWAVSIHFLTSSASNRNDEARALIGYIQANVPPGDYLVIGGDFNSSARNETQFTTLSAVVRTAGPHPADQAGNENTNASRAKPYDSVFPSENLHSLQTPVVIGGNAFPNGLVVDTRVYTPLSDISPALSGDSGASQMQHMAIVKDYLLSPPADPPLLQIVSTGFSFGPPVRGTITFHSTATATYQLEAASDSLSTSWTTLGEITAASAVTTIVIVPSTPSPGQIHDPLFGIAPRRFYRVVRR